MLKSVLFLCCYFLSEGLVLIFVFIPFFLLLWRVNSLKEWVLLDLTNLQVFIAQIHVSGLCVLALSIIHGKTEMKHLLLSLLLLLSLRRCRISSSEVKVCPSTGNFVRKTYDFCPHHFEFGSTQDISQTIIFMWTSKDQDGKNSHKYLIWFIH